MHGSQYALQVFGITLTLGSRINEGVLMSGGGGGGVGTLGKIK